jgi:hypothetical protein
MTASRNSAWVRSVFSKFAFAKEALDKSACDNIAPGGEVFELLLTTQSTGARNRIEFARFLPRQIFISLWQLSLS